MVRPSSAFATHNTDFLGNKGAGDIKAVGGWKGQKGVDNGRGFEKNCFEGMEVRNKKTSMSSLTLMRMGVRRKHAQIFQLSRTDSRARRMHLACSSRW